MVKGGLIRKILLGGVTIAAMGAFGCGDNPIGPKIEPPKPEVSISQKVKLINDIDIAYEAILENTKKAEREITHNGNPIDTTTITGPVYADTLKTGMKGSYNFISMGDTVSIDILDYRSQAPDLSYLILNIPEGDSIIVYLKRATDINIGDNPVQYISVTSPDGRIIPTIGAFPLDTVLKLRATGNPGPFQIELSYEGNPEKIISQGNISNLLHIIGQLQDTRTDSGEFGIIRVYNPLDTTLMKEVLTDTEGNFDFQLDQSLDSILLQARLETGIPDNNYVRTITLPAAMDTMGLMVRAYPYNNVLADAGISREDFRKHLEQLNPGFFKWNLDSLQGVEILDVDPLGRGSFTSVEQDAIEQTFRANLACYTGGRLNGNDLYIQKDNSSTPDSLRHYINEERNWIYVFPNNSVDGGSAGTKDGNGTIYLVSIELELTTSEFVKAHEDGHAFIAPNNHHATTLPGSVTIMRSSSLKRPGPADCEVAYIINETTYPPLENIDNMLGLNFFPLN